MRLGDLFLILMELLPAAAHKRRRTTHTAFSRKNDSQLCTRADMTGCAASDAHASS